MRNLRNRRVIAKGEYFMTHKLMIKSLHDAQAECFCGWYFVSTGEKTKEEIHEEYEKHITRKSDVIDEVA
jgi:hypothetical protein